MLLPQRPHRAQLRVLLDEPHAGVDEERDPREDRAHEVGVDTVAHRVEHRHRVGHRVGDLLNRRRPRLLEVIAADVDRVELRDLGHRVGDHVGDQPHRGPGWEGVRAAGQELLDDVVLRGALEQRRIDAVLLGGDDVERQQPGRGGVDRHRRVHLVERDAVHERVHVALVGDRHADLADFSARQLVVGVVAGLGGQVEGDRQPGLALGQVSAIELVGLLGRRMPCVRTHHPRPVGLRKTVIAHRGEGYGQCSSAP